MVLFMRGMVAAATWLTSWWVSGVPPMPAAQLQMQESPATRRPSALATMASGTVYMPTASAPIERYSLISAGVSKVGPLVAM